MRRKASSLLGRLALAGASVTLALALFELALRAVDFPREVGRQGRGCAGLAEVGWAIHYYASAQGHYPPGSVFPICRDEFQILYRTDAAGFLGTADAGPSERPVLVFGDSFAFGFGVEPQEAFACALSAYNAGLWGLSFPQHAIAFRQAADVARPRRALWIVHPPHLITASDPAYEAPVRFDRALHPFLYRLAGRWNTFRLSTLVLVSTGWGVNRPDFFTREWALYDPEDRSLEQGYGAFARAAADAAAFARERGIELNVVFAPSKKQLALALEKRRPLLVRAGRRLDPTLPQRRLSELARRAGIPATRLVDLLDLFARSPVPWRQLYFTFDLHWNARGHAAVAEFLERRLAERR